ncbi:MAG TPA: hypothetical protein VJU82_13135, partial [Acidobacteriaceae bacterium]|nr:hypothetical protein [Acidobacteriaceae bacterium]
MSLDFFLTAYDPSDLPGTSIDPLGFERGYLFLADRILPGLTNVAARPRYFGMLCAGIHLAGVDSTTPPRSAYSQRLPVLLRMERLWGLANVLASSSRGDAEGQLQGIRGLRYLQARSVVLGDRRMTQTSADFRVLSRQVQYGVVGIYAAVAQGMRMLGDRRALSLTPDLGDRLGEAFVDETEMPAPIRTAVKDDKPVSLAVLADWGGRAHVSGRAGAEERRCLRDAVIRNAVRLRMTRLLAEHQAEEGEEELQRLTRVERSLRDREEDEDLRDAVQAIIAYEGAYRIAQLALERLIWLCRKSPALDVRNCEGDEVLQLVLQRLPKSVGKLQGILDAAKSFGFGSDLTAMEDV